MFNPLIEFIRDIYKTNEFIPLHAPTFSDIEKDYVCQTLDSTFVSSVGKFVDQFEAKVENFTGTSKAIATVNGTAALHTALYLAGIKQGDLVITQALTFVATCNVIFHMGAQPVFIDISKVSLGLCPKAVRDWLEEHAELDSKSICRHKTSGSRISAVVPMHTFGHPVELTELIEVCKDWKLSLVEDAAESLGSFYKGNHTGTYGQFGALSFNGNKIITTGSGGMVLCRSAEDGKKAKHITTTAKTPHPYEYFHDEPGFNYRLPNINSALGCGQMEKLPQYLESKRRLAQHYKCYFHDTEFEFIDQPEYAKSNFWLNAVMCPDFETREKLLQETNASGIGTRPVWKLMHKLPMFRNSMRGDLQTSEWVESHLVNLPSSPTPINLPSS